MKARIAMKHNSVQRCHGTLKVNSSTHHLCNIVGKTSIHNVQENGTCSHKDGSSTASRGVVGGIVPVKGTTLNGYGRAASQDYCSSLAYTGQNKKVSIILEPKVLPASFQISTRPTSPPTLLRKTESTMVRSPPEAKMAPPTVLCNRNQKIVRRYILYKQKDIQQILRTTGLWLFSKTQS